MTTRACDTSTAVPLLLKSHPEHKAVSGAVGRPLCLSGHAVAETYAVLTRLPGDARISPVEAAHLIEARFEAPVVMTKRTLNRLPKILADARVAGGATYDALVGLAARDCNRTLVTRDQRAARTYQAIGATFELLPSNR